MLTENVEECPWHFHEKGNWFDRNRQMYFKGTNNGAMVSCWNSHDGALFVVVLCSYPGGTPI